jgi:hypothetical protein
MKRGRPKGSKDNKLPFRELYTALNVLTAMGKCESIVSDIAAAENVSKRTVYYRLRRRRRWASDALLSAARIMEWGAARDSLAKEHGNQEFSDEEIKERIELERLKSDEFDP